MLHNHKQQLLQQLLILQQLRDQRLQQRQHLQQEIRQEYYNSSYNNVNNNNDRLSSLTAAAAAATTTTTTPKKTYCYNYNYNNNYYSSSKSSRSYQEQSIIYPQYNNYYNSNYNNHENDDQNNHQNDDNHNDDDKLAGCSKEYCSSLLRNELYDSDDDDYRNNNNNKTVQTITSSSEKQNVKSSCCVGSSSSFYNDNDNNSINYDNIDTTALNPTGNEDTKLLVAHNTNNIDNNNESVSGGEPAKSDMATNFNNNTYNQEQQQQQSNTASTNKETSNNMTTLSLVQWLQQQQQQPNADDTSGGIMTPDNTNNDDFVVTTSTTTTTTTTTFIPTMMTSSSSSSTNLCTGLNDINNDDNGTTIVVASTNNSSSNPNQYDITTTTNNNDDDDLDTKPSAKKYNNDNNINNNTDRANASNNNMLSIDLTLSATDNITASSADNPTSPPTFHTTDTYMTSIQEYNNSSSFKFDDETNTNNNGTPGRSWKKLKTLHHADSSSNSLQSELVDTTTNIPSKTSNDDVVTNSNNNYYDNNKLSQKNYAIRKLQEVLGRVEERDQLGYNNKKQLCNQLSSMSTDDARMAMKLFPDVSMMCNKNNNNNNKKTNYNQNNNLNYYYDDNDNDDDNGTTGAVVSNYTSYWNADPTVSPQRFALGYQNMMQNPNVPTNCYNVHTPQATSGTASMTMMMSPTVNKSFTTAVPLLPQYITTTSSTNSSVAVATALATTKNNNNNPVMYYPTQNNYNGGTFDNSIEVSYPTKNHNDNDDDDSFINDFIGNTTTEDEELNLSFNDPVQTLWYWEVEYGSRLLQNTYFILTGTNFVAYAFDVASQIEDAYQQYKEKGTETYSFVLQNNKSYTINFRLMEQTNTVSWKTRKIRRNTEQYIIPEGCAEYNEIESFFLTSLGKGQSVSIVKIERIDNPSLLDPYLAKLKAMKQRDSDNPNNRINNINRDYQINNMTIPFRARRTSTVQSKSDCVLERQWLFHGTKKEAVLNIIKHGFNRSFAKDGVAFGRGVYFARDASYSCATRYAQKDNDGIQYIFLCRVAVGDWCRGRHNLLVPSTKPNSDCDTFDTTVDNEIDPSIFVVYNDCQAYPEYLVSFRENERNYTRRFF